MIVAIVNADDFGLSESVNQGIQAAYENGVLRSASLMANGEGFDDAVSRGKKLHGLGVGIHLSLVGERPLASSSQLGDLVGTNGRLPASYADFFRGYLSGRFTRREVRLEMEAQIVRVLSAGIRPTHLDSHQHVHLIPGLFDLALDLAEAHQISVVRVPYDREMFSRMPTSAREIQLSLLVILSVLAQRKARKRGLRCVSSFHGLNASGHLDTIKLCDIFSRLRNGVHEIICHPGFETAALRHRYEWGYEWEIEAKALRSAAVKQLVERRGIDLRNFAQAWLE
jgi:hopanoid biosynthesis associated protein HpnK